MPGDSIWSGPALGCLVLIAASPWASAATPTPPLAKVGVIAIAVIPQPLEGAPTRADQDALLRRLSDEATARAERSLLRQQIAASVERLPSRALAAEPAGRSAISMPASGSSTGEVYLTGTIRLPLSLPPSITRDWTWFRHGRFASAEVRLLRADGSTITRAAAILDWSDIRWFSGAGRVRSARPLDDVLVDFVRKAADQAVKHLKRQRLAATAREGERSCFRLVSLPSEKSAVSSGMSIAAPRSLGARTKEALPTITDQERAGTRYYRWLFTQGQVRRGLRDLLPLQWSIDHRGRQKDLQERSAGGSACRSPAGQERASAARSLPEGHFRNRWSAEPIGAHPLAYRSSHPATLAETPLFEVRSSFRRCGSARIPWGLSGWRR